MTLKPQARRVGGEQAIGPDKLVRRPKELLILGREVPVKLNLSLRRPTEASLQFIRCRRMAELFRHRLFRRPSPKKQIPGNHMKLRCHSHRKQHNFPTL